MHSGQETNLTSFNLPLPKVNVLAAEEVHFQAILHSCWRKRRGMADRLQTLRVTTRTFNMLPKGRHQLSDTKVKLADRGPDQKPCFQAATRPENSRNRDKRQGLTVLFFKGHLRSNRQQYLLSNSTCGQGPHISPEMKIAQHFFQREAVAPSPSPWALHCLSST